ncbi:redoxin domain-containing protein [Candidatus Poribacteria bacterium]|nr:redoxin domain-containing protein [Candidatus Poribacteria bacterium]MYB63335.1 redoxin domain-containing protein [Candidatus Poribacteria bacterium]MYF54272.1 redoxin domain-containing protein [Candidatus Poribacteria bacterium]MYI94679.1 redoxin domain-containing protein [Candidatus Poribacteria bacterium]
MYDARIYITLLILLFCAIGCENSDNPVDDIASTKGTLQVEVLNQQNVSFQVALYQGEEIVAKTDSNRSFEITDIEAGSYILRLTAAGYKEIERNVEILAGQVISIDGVTLQPTSQTESNLGQGLNIGTRAPDFELPDGNGNLHSLSQYLDNGKDVVLVFYRFGG